MLKIWYYRGIDYIKDAPGYFDNVYEDEWLEDPFVKEMIRDVDNSSVISAHIIESPVLGAITPKELSGGVKVLIADSAAFGALNEDCLHTTCCPGTVKKYLHSSRMF